MGSGRQTPTPSAAVSTRFTTRHVVTFTTCSLIILSKYSKPQKLKLFGTSETLFAIYDRKRVTAKEALLRIWGCVDAAKSCTVGGGLCSCASQLLCARKSGCPSRCSLTTESTTSTRIVYVMSYSSKWFLSHKQGGSLH